MTKKTALSKIFVKHFIAPFTLAILVQTATQAAENPEGVQQGDPNPGSVPNTILGEVDTLEISNLGGHKIYAGTGHTRNSPSYLNVDFHCDGSGTYEVYYSDIHSYSSKKKGTLEWKIRDDGARVTTKVIEATEGKRFTKSVNLSMRPRTGSAVNVGQTLVEGVETARIVQHTKCESNKLVSTANGAAIKGYSPILFYKNPGAIPSQILEEVDEVIVANLGGIKVFSGPDNDLPSQEEYFNIQFDCDGSGTFETYPPQGLKGAQKVLFKPTEGTLNWEVKKNKLLQITIKEFTKNRLIAKKEIDIKDTIGMERLAKIGETRIEEQIISRMVRYKECS